MMSVWVPLLSSSSLRFKSSIFMCSIILHTTVYICNIFVLVVASRAKNVVIHGTEYRIGASVFLGAEEDFEIPEFGSIFKIAVLPTGGVFFYIKKFSTVEKDSHFHAYKVRQEMNPEKTLLQQHELATYLPAHAVRPYGSTMLCGGMYIAPRYAVCIL